VLVRDLLVLLVAAGVAGFVVWRLTTGTGLPPRPVRRKLPRTRARRRPIRFEETAEVTGISSLIEERTAFEFSSEEGVEDRPHRARSVAALVATVALAAALIAAAITGILGFIKQVLDSNLK
jgi:hypothetical protein